MDAKAFHAARDKLSAAHEKLVLLQASSRLSVVKRTWSDVLVEIQRVYLRLQKALEHGPGKFLVDRLRCDQKTDPLLQYVHQARNADEHGTKAVLEMVPGMVVGPPMGPGLPNRGISIDEMRMDEDGRVHLSGVRTSDGTPADVKVFHGHFKLRSVRNRGREFLVPEIHFGALVADQSPAGVAALAISYLDRFVADAVAQFPEIDVSPPPFEL